MSDLYDSVLNAYRALKEKHGREPGTIDLENAGGTVRVSAFFQKGGGGKVCEIKMTAKPGPRLDEAVSKYGGRVFSYGAESEVLPGEKLYGVELKQGMLVDAIDAELPAKIGTGDADALKKTFELLKIPHEYGRGLSVGTHRLHRNVKPEDCQRAFDAISDSGRIYPYLSSSGKDSSVHASRRGLFVALEFGEGEGEARTRRRIDELHSFLAGCGNTDDGFEVKLYGLRNEDAPRKKFGRSATIEV